MYSALSPHHSALSPQHSPLVMFDWQTEEDHWDDDPLITAETAVSRNYRPWLMVLIIVIIAGGAGLVLYREVTQRIDTATANVQNDILASHNLLLFAHQEKDGELFHTILSGRESHWAATQMELLQAGLLLDRHSFGLTWEADTERVSLSDIQEIDPDTITIEIDPQFDSATMVYERPYTIQLGNNITETVILKQTAVYRRGTQRWLYAPPGTDFWGAPRTYEGRYLFINYPARDEAIIAQLGPALDRKLDEMCRTLPDINCPAGWEVWLNLLTTPDSLLSIADSHHILENGRFVELPTPTLVGLPVDETGFQALYRGYASHLIAGTMTDLIGYPCCRNSALFQAMVDFHLADLGLRPSPLNKQDISRILLTESMPAAIMLDANLLSQPNLLNSPAGEKLYALVHFFRDQQPDLSLVAIQRELVQADDLYDWLGMMLGYEHNTPLTTSVTALNEALLAYAISQVDRTAPPPIPLPDQVVQAICSPTPDTSATTAYRLTLGVNEVRPLPMIPNPFALMLPLPDDNLAVMPLTSPEPNSSWQTYLWRSGEAEPALIANDGATFSFGQSNPTQQQLVAYNFSATGVRVPANLLDLNDCTESNCGQTALAGIPSWSPNGRQTIVAGYESFLQSTLIINGRSFLFDARGQINQADLYLGDERGDIEDTPSFAHGYAPFWIDDQNIGYLQLVGSNNQATQMVIRSLLMDVEQTVLEYRFAAALPESAPQNTQLQLRYVIPHPTNPAILFVAVYDRTRAISYIFSWNWQTDTLDFQLQARGDAEHSLGVSPDGEWLILTGATESRLLNNNAAALHLHHVASKETQTIDFMYPNFNAAALYDWSLDGQWLIVQINSQAFLLLAPEHDYLEVVPYEFGVCTSIAWFNGE